MGWSDKFWTIFIVSNVKLEAYEDLIEKCVRGMESRDVAHAP